MSVPIVFDRVLTARSNDEWEDPIDAARITLTASFVRRVLAVGALVEEHGLASAKLWSQDVEWGFLDADEAGFVSASDPTSPRCGEFRSECNQATVYSEGGEVSVVWTAYWKHTQVKVCTDAVRSEDLQRALDSGAGAVGQAN